MEWASPPQQRKQATGMGLHIMDYRARTIGGTLDIGPGRRGGTMVSCCVPRARQINNRAYEPQVTHCRRHAEAQRAFCWWMTTPWCANAWPKSSIAKPDLIVCGEAEDRHGAIAAILAKPPDLVIVDLTLKNSDGLELIKDIHARWPKMRMLVVSMHDESLYAERVIRAGALGYITKQEATRKILLAIRRVLAGSIYLNEKIASRIISRLTAHADQVDGHARRIAGGPRVPGL